LPTASCLVPSRAPLRPSRSRTRQQGEWGPRPLEMATTTTRSPVSGWSAGGIPRALWCSQIPPTMILPCRTSPPGEMPTRPPRETWRRRGAEPAWRRSAAPNLTTNAPAGNLRLGPPMGRNRQANLPRPRRHPPPSRAKEDGWSGTPRECSCTKTFTSCLTFPLTSFPPFLSRDAEEKKRKTGQTTPGPDPAATATPTTPRRAAGEEEDRASTDA
jgi:hypothetical protein